MTELRDVQCKGTAWQEAPDKEEGGEENKLDELIDSIAGKAGEGGPGGKVSCW